MGTRADFYIGRGKDAKWIGSIGMDGYPDGLPEELLAAKTEEGFIAELTKFAAGCRHWTPVENGWPWPWADSHTTDYSYAFDGEVFVSRFGYGWRTAAEVAAFEARDDDSDDEKFWDKLKTAEFPDMTDVQNVTFGAGSGLILLKGPAPE